MRVVNISHLETGTLTGKTTRTQSRQTTLVRQLSQRVGLIHELAELVRAEKRIDNARHGPRIDQILRREFICISQVHPLFDGSGHTGQTEREL